MQENVIALSSLWMVRLSFYETCVDTGISQIFYCRILFPYCFVLRNSKPSRTGQCVSTFCERILILVAQFSYRERSNSTFYRYVLTLQFTRTYELPLKGMTLYFPPPLSPLQANHHAATSTSNYLVQQKAIFFFFFSPALVFQPPELTHIVTT